MRQRLSISFLATSVLLSLPGAASAEAFDWPQLRGPNLDGISKEAGLLHLWPESGPEVLWRIPLGKGFSAISAVDGRLFTVFSRDGEERVAAFDAATGSELWHLRIDAEREDGQGDGPRSTPTVDDGVVFAVSASGKMVALEATSGTPRWARDLVATLGARVPTWGVAASPLVVGDLLIFDAGAEGGAVVALDKRSGELRWKAGDHLAGYAMPILVTVDGAQQVVVFGGTELLALDPATGAVRWRLPWKTSYDVNAATPIFLPPDRIYVSSGYDVGAAMLRLGSTAGQTTVEELWRSRAMKNQFSSSIADRGTLYGFDNKSFKAIDAATGEERWREGGFGHGSLLLADGLLLVLSDSGTLALVEATPEAYRELARAQIAKGRHWTVPTLWDGKLYIRNEREMVCLRVTPRPAN